MVGFAWFGLHYWATSLKLAVQFQMLSPMEENWRLFLLDGLRFAMMVAGVLAVLIVARHFPAGVVALLSASPVVPTFVVLVIAAYIFVGILAFYAAAFVLFFVVRTLERSIAGASNMRPNLPHDPTTPMLTRARKAASTATRTIWRASPT